MVVKFQFCGNIGVGAGAVLFKLSCLMDSKLYLYLFDAKKFNAQARTPDLDEPLFSKLTKAISSFDMRAAGCSLSAPASTADAIQILDGSMAAVGLSPPSRKAVPRRPADVKPVLCNEGKFRRCCSESRSRMISGAAASIAGEPFFLRCSSEACAPHVGTTTAPHEHILLRRHVSVLRFRSHRVVVPYQ
jgi:hypothetical protein